MLWKPTRRLMAEADQQRIDKIAPQSYDDAQKALQIADEYIGQNPYAREIIQEKADHAYFMAQRMMSIAKNCRRFESLKPESSALYIEEQMIKLSAALNVGDIRNIDTADQVSALTIGGSKFNDHQP